MLSSDRTAILPAEVAEKPKAAGGERTYRDEIVLMRAVVDGDPRAQKKLVLRIMPHLRAISRTLLGNSADADDAVQVSLMKILKAAKDYRAEGSLERWARRIGVRTCLRVAKRERRHRSAVDPATELAELTADRGGPRLAESLPRSVQYYVERLPESQREAVLLRHALDYSVAEIAELTAAPVDTVKSRLLFGRRALRKLVRQDLAISEAKTSMQPASSPGNEKKHA